MTMAMQFQIETARKSDTRARIALYGPSGSGKTYTALEIAKGLTDQHERIVVLDTENRSAAKYADGRWKHLKMPSTDMETYIEAIKFAQNQADVLIIDSLSHAWFGLDGALQKKDEQAYKSGNSYTAWGKVTPVHHRLIFAMIDSTCHLIATMRAKTAHVIEGKTVRKVGLDPVQRDGMEYEFDLLCSLTPDHTMHVEKTRHSALDGKTFKRPGPEFGRTVLEWLSDVDAITGEPIEPRREKPSVHRHEPQGALSGKALLIRETEGLAKLLGLDKGQAWSEHIMPAVRESGAQGWSGLSIEMAQDIVDRIRSENTPPEGDDFGGDDPFAGDGFEEGPEPSTDGQLDSRDTNLPPHPEPVDELDQVEELTDRQRGLLRADNIRTRDQLRELIKAGGRPKSMREETLRTLKVSLGLQDSWYPDDPAHNPPSPPDEPTEERMRTICNQCLSAEAIPGRNQCHECAQPRSADQLARVMFSRHDLGDCETGDMRAVVLLAEELERDGCPNAVTLLDQTAEALWGDEQPLEEIDADQVAELESVARARLDATESIARFAAAAESEEDVA